MIRSEGVQNTAGGDSIWTTNNLRRAVTILKNTLHFLAISLVKLQRQFFQHISSRVFISTDVNEMKGGFFFASFFCCLIESDKAVLDYCLFYVSFVWPVSWIWNNCSTRLLVQTISYNNLLDYSSVCCFCLHNDVATLLAFSCLQCWLDSCSILCISQSRQQGEVHLNKSLCCEETHRARESKLVWDQMSDSNDKSSLA